MQETLNAILAELKAIRRILEPDAPASANPYATVARAHASHLEQRRSQPRIVTQNGIKANADGQG